MGSHSQSSRFEKNLGGFEVSVVLVVVALLAALTIRPIPIRQPTSDKNRTVLAHALIKMGLEQYEEKYGDYPEPSHPADTTLVSHQEMRVGGARMLYQALTGDGDSEIKVKPASSSDEGTDGKSMEDDTADLIREVLHHVSVVRDPKGDYFVDLWNQPFQYVKGGSDDALNSTYDLWSFGDPKSSSGEFPYDAEARRDLKKTARWVKNW